MWGGQTAACIPLWILHHVQVPSFLQIKPLLTIIPRAKTFSIIYSAALQMLPFFWTSVKLDSSCPTPVRLEQVCIVQHYFLGPYLKPVLTVSTHISPSPCGAQLFHGNQRPDPFHTCTQVSGGTEGPRNHSPHSTTPDLRAVCLSALPCEQNGDRSSLITLQCLWRYRYPGCFLVTLVGKPP